MTITKIDLKISLFSTSSINLKRVISLKSNLFKDFFDVINKYANNYKLNVYFLYFTYFFKLEFKLFAHIYLK